MARRLLTAASLLLALLLGPLLPGAAAQDRKPASAAQGPAAFQVLAPGLEYRHEVRPNGPWSIHVLRLDRTKQRWDLHTELGQGTVFGLEPLDGIVVRVAAAVHDTPLAAINGDFFVIKPGPYQGDPRGIQISQGELVSRATGNSLWVSPQGELKIGPVASKLRAVWPDGKTEIPLGLNEARPDDGAVLFTPTLGIRPKQAPNHAPGTRTARRKRTGPGMPRRPARLPLEVGTRYRLRVREVRPSGDTPLPPGRLILSLGPKQVPRLPPVQPGDLVQVAVETEPDLRGVKTAIGCGRNLIRGGRLPELGPPNQPRHPALDDRLERAAAFLDRSRRPAAAVVHRHDLSGNGRPGPTVRLHRRRGA